MWSYLDLLQNGLGCPPGFASLFECKFFAPTGSGGASGVGAAARPIGGGGGGIPPEKVAANNGTPATPKPTTTSTLSKLKSWGKWYICGNSPEGAIKNWMETGATKGAIGGAIAGAGTVGVATFGVGGVPGAALGGVVGGVVGAGAGVIWGGGAAAVCYYAGAYDHP
jgi:hypothetical protein